MSPDKILQNFPGYVGWGTNEMIADFNATGGNGKGGGGNGSPTLPKFEFDQKQAENDAMEELRPYYEKLLTIYNGDVALAKKRIEQDYERGLRFSRDTTKNALEDNQAARDERARKFTIALGDLDQEMNTRGIFNSGIKTGDTQNAKADEAFQDQKLKNEARDLNLSQTQYEESLGVKKERDMQDDADGEVVGIDGYYNTRQKKQFEWANEMTTRGREMANWKRQQKFNDYQAGITPIATAQPQNYNTLLNKALEMQGLPPAK